MSPYDLFDEFGRPKYPGSIMDDGGDPLARLEQQTQQPPEPPQPLIGSADTGMAPPPPPKPGHPNSFLYEQSHIDTSGPNAQQAARNAQNYSPPLYEEQGQVRHMPQQYGQPGSVYDPDEGPLSPQAAADAMPTNNDAMKKLIMQHLLPMHPQLKKMSPDGRQQALAAQKENEAIQREQRMQRGAANRAAAAEKDQAAWDQTLRYNQLQGAGVGDSTSFGGQGGGPTVRNVGGFNFVSGRWRPQTPEEQANVNYKNAQADYYRSRPQIEAERQSSINQRQDDQQEFTAERDRLKGELANKGRQNTIDKEQQKLAYKARANLDEIVRQIMEREGIADEEVTAGTRGGWNPMRMLPDFVVGKNAPDREPFLDDVKVKGKYERRPNSYQSLLDELQRADELIQQFHEKGYDVGEVPDNVKALISKARNRRKPQ